MSSELQIALAFSAMLGSGLIAGVFFAFSTFVMRALGRLPEMQGLAAMQSINVAVINPVFLGVFLGTAALCGALAIQSLLDWHLPRAPWLLAGSLVYLFGCFLVTMAGNVPLNNALAAVTPGGGEGAELWRGYLVRWTAWNHVRAAASLVAMACLAVALR
jgi:uncharacterized membrane protein